MNVVCNLDDTQFNSVARSVTPDMYSDTGDGAKGGKTGQRAAHRPETHPGPRVLGQQAVAQVVERSQ